MSYTTIDSNVVRLGAFFVIILLISGLYYPIIFIFIFIDFLLKSIKLRYSFLSFLAKIILHKILKLKIKPVDAFPKKFAMKIGLVFSILILTTLFFELNLIFNIILSMFLTATFLEAFFNYCFGCKIYSILFNLKILK